MKKLIMIVACAALAGCSVTKVEYEKNDKGEVSYRVYRNSHWLKMDAEGMKGGMSGDGKFEIALDGMKASPSEEFNRTMQTYTTAFVQLAQIAAAAYNPSASAAVKNATAKQSGGTAQAATAEQGAAAAQPAAATAEKQEATAPAASAADCADCTVPATATATETAK